VTAPAPTPTQRPAPVGSLVISADTSDDGVPWTDGIPGVEFRPSTCDDNSSGVVDPCESAEKLVDDNEAIRIERAFGVWVGEKCSAIGATYDDIAARARARLAVCESKLIAAEFWDGALEAAAGWDNLVLTDAANSDTLGRGMTLADGLACLEQHLGDCGCGAQGMIHATRQIATLWAATELIARTPVGTLETKLGTVVVADAGYSGNGPGGEAAADGAIWAYATDFVKVRRSEIVVVPGDAAGALDRDVNLFEVRAERLALVQFSGCCHAAVSLDVNLCESGGVS
jgi:hypothetical protein